VTEAVPAFFLVLATLYTCAFMLGWALLHAAGPEAAGEPPRPVGGDVALLEPLMDEATEGEGEGEDDDDDDNGWMTMMVINHTTSRQTKRSCPT
jgi:hypothetical protein